METMVVVAGIEVVGEGSSTKSPQIHNTPYLLTSKVALRCLSVSLAGEATPTVAVSPKSAINFITFLLVLSIISILC